jgi:urease accessory protein
MTSRLRFLATRSPRLALASTIAGVLVATAATPAVAHTGGPTYGFTDGALHPLGGPDHFLAMMAVGIVAAVLAAPIAIPSMFLVAMTAGGAAGLAGLTLPAVELLVVGSVIALGVAIVVAVGRGRIAWLIPLMVIAGLAHGNAHGAEAPDAANPALYVIGFLIATAALHATGVLSGAALRRWTPARIAVGAGVAAAGVVLLVG